MVRSDRCVVCHGQTIGPLTAATQPLRTGLYQDGGAQSLSLSSAGWTRREGARPDMLSDNEVPAVSLCLFHRLCASTAPVRSVQATPIIGVELQLEAWR